MKQLLLILFVFAFLNSIAQEKEFHLQGQVVDAKKNPIADVYLFNPRSSFRNISHTNGVFDVWVLPGDSIIITHLSFLRKTVTAYQLMVDPIVQLELDTINIRSVNVSPNQRTDYEKAMKNMERIEYDFKPLPTDNYTENERMKTLLITEDQLQSVAASSVSLARFSPSEEIGKLIAKHKKKKEAKQFSSTKESEIVKEK
jgi:hypothetical protein